MEIASVPYSNVFNDSKILKPNYHLNYGKKRIERALKKNNAFTTLGEAVKDLYTGGIFKRVFVEKKEFGLPYISAQHMMYSNPLEFAKTISKKYTPRQEDMTLRANQILISCAGTVGNVRLITEDLNGIIGSQDIIRVNSNNTIYPYGYIYAYLASPTAYNYIQSYIYGSVVPRISPDTLANLPVPILSKFKQQEIHNLIVETSELRVKANKLLSESRKRIKKYANLKDLTTLDYEYFGTYNDERPISVFNRSVSEISSTSINAFNYSKRVEKIESRVKSNSYSKLSDCLDDNQFFSTGSFRRLEIESDNSIKLINQSDIFNMKKQGKQLARKFVKTDKLVEYGEVLIAGVGTLGENETFCNAIFCNEELEGQLIAGEFIRMKTNKKVLSGYLYCWLSTNYGFRLIRKTHTGTKLCRPILEILKNIPVPILDYEKMREIDDQVKKAHTMMYEALNIENKAIDIIEKEIESWQK